MNKQQMEACLLEMVRITRSFREAIRQITELKVEITALCEVIEANGLASPEQLLTVRDQARARLKEVEVLTLGHGAVVVSEAEGDWTM